MDEPKFINLNKAILIYTIIKLNGSNIDILLTLNKIDELYKLGIID